jgi:hypothetical protein
LLQLNTLWTAQIRNAHVLWRLKAKTLSGQTFRLITNTSVEYIRSVHLVPFLYVRLGLLYV